MKKLVCVLFFAFCAMTALAADVSGKWTGTFTPEEGEAGQGTLILKQNGIEITGTGGPSDGEQMAISNGKIDGNKVTFEISHPSGMTMKMSLVLDGDTLKGDVTASRDGQTMKARMELTREKS